MHRFNVVGFRALLVLLLGGAAVMTACDGGCPEGTTLRKGICVQPSQDKVDGMANADSAATGADDATGAATGGQAVPSAGAGKPMSTAGNRAAPTNPGALGASAGSSGGAPASNVAATTQAGSGGPQSGPSVAQPSAAAGSPMMSVPMAGMDAAGAMSEAGAGGTACTPTAETCDGADNDCDAKIDEEIAPQPCGLNKGICKPGTIECRNGKWDDEKTQCQGAVGPSAMGEQCDAAKLDENCDGMANENCACTAGETMPCSTGKYTCKQGTVSCVDGKFSTRCENEVQGSAETCDGKDNDCDGRVDNGGDSLCSRGQHCIDGSCVQCTGNEDCASMSTACQDGYCNSSHMCAVRPKTDHAACTGSSGSGVCSKGTCISGCIDDTDCKGGKTCSARGDCVNPCGNGRVDPGEDCDSSAGSAACDTNCKKIAAQSTIYGACTTIGSDTSECSNGGCLNLSTNAHICVPHVTCNSTNTGAACTYPDGRQGQCNLTVCFLVCNRDDDCPAQSTCVQPNMTSGVGLCR